MAERPKGYGMTAEVADQINAKYDKARAGEVCEWIMHHVSDADLSGKEAVEDLHEALKDGIVLCKLINALQPKSVAKINESKMAFKQMENISNFLLGCEKMGVLRSDLFQTVSLYEATNMAQVVDGIYALGRKAAKNDLVGIGPKESEKNVRHFTEAEIKAGRDSTIGLQAGYNKGANQGGQNFGKTRAIID